LQHLPAAGIVLDRVDPRHLRVREPTRRGRAGHLLRSGLPATVALLALLVLALGLVFLAGRLRAFDLQRCARVLGQREGSLASGRGLLCGLGLRLLLLLRCCVGLLLSLLRLRLRVLGGLLTGCTNLVLGRIVLDGDVPIGVEEGDQGVEILLAAPGLDLCELALE
jgi:hypothetical protein